MILKSSVTAIWAWAMVLAMQENDKMDTYQKAIEFLAGMFGYDQTDKSEEALATFVVDATSELAMENTAFEIGLQNDLNLSQSIMLHDLLAEYIDELPDNDDPKKELEIDQEAIQNLINIVKSGKLEN